MAHLKEVHTVASFVVAIAGGDFVCTSSGFGHKLQVLDLVLGLKLGFLELNLVGLCRRIQLVLLHLALDFLLLDLQVLLLKCQQRILCLLLSSLLLSLGLILLEQTCGCVLRKLGDLKLHFWRHRLILVHRRQHRTKLRLDVLAVLERDMLHDVSHCRALNCLRLRVLSNH